MQAGSVEIEIRANLAPFQAGLKQAETAAKQFAQQAGQAAGAALPPVKGLGDAFQAAGQTAGRSVRAVENDMVNLRFQINDVATGLMSGGSPFMILMQQAGQFSQILDRQEGGIRGAAKLMGEAFTSMLSPINLAIVGIGVATYAATQYFSTTEDGTKAAEEALSRHADMLEEIKKRYGEVAEGIDRARQKSDEWLASQAGFNAEDRAKSLMDVSGDFLTKTTVDIFGQNTVAEQFLPFKQAIEDFRASVQAGEPDVAALEAAINDLKGGAEDGGRAMVETAQALLDMNAAAKEAENMAFLTSVMANLSAAIKAVGADAYMTADGLVAMGAAWGANQEALNFSIGMGPRSDDPKNYARGGPSMGPDWRGPALVPPDVRPPAPYVDLVNDPAPRMARGGGGRRGGEGGGVDPFERATERAQERLRLLEQEKTAIGMSGEALARYRAEMEFLNSVHSDWNKLTEAQKTALEQEAAKIGEATAEIEGLKTAQQEAEVAAGAIGSSLENLFMGIIQGGEAAKMAVAQLVAELLRAALLGDGPLGGLFGGGILGGVTGGADAAATVNVPRSAAPGSARAMRPGMAGGSSVGGATIVIQGNADSGTVAAIDSRLRRFQRDIVKQMDERDQNRWRN
jgi:hypothetical protein